MFPDQPVQDFLHGPHQPFPSATHVRRSWRIERPVDVERRREVGDLPLVHLRNEFLQLLGRSFEIGPVVRVHVRWRTPSVDESSQCIDE